MISVIGSGVSVVGTIDCDGPAEMFGRIQGEIRAADLLIGQGAQIAGNVVARETICGRVKGTIRADRVNLHSGGAVEGDIFHRSLSIDEGSLFEGTSRRVENPIDELSSVEAKSTHDTGGEVNDELDLRELLHGQSP
jgi:cytoskeletal protein CcmA (bactofilin family)